MLLLPFYLFTAMFFFANGTAEPTCACEDPANRANWSAIIEEGTCLGECNGRKQVQRKCILTTGIVENCMLIESCINSNTCRGSWSQWANTEACPGLCSFQNQSRSCYKKTDNKTRTTSCAGSNNTSEMTRLSPCRTSACTTRRRRNHTTIEPSTSASVKPTSSFLTTLKHLASDQTTSNLLRATKQETTTPSIPLPSPQNPETLTLPLVLCAVAVICVAVIISFVIIFKRRPYDQRSNALSSDSSSKENNNEKKTKETHNYEDVGPALPPSRNTKDVKNGDISLTVHNVLYSRNGNDQGATYLPLSPSSTDAEYLSPVTNSLPEEDSNTKTDRDLKKMQFKEDVVLVDPTKKRSIPNEGLKDGDYIKEVGVIVGDAVANRITTDSPSLAKTSNLASSSEGDLKVKSASSNEYTNDITKLSMQVTKTRFEHEPSLKSNNDMNRVSGANGSPRKIPNRKGNMTCKEVKVNSSSQDYSLKVNENAASDCPQYEETENGYVKDFTLLQASELEGNYVKDITMPEGNLPKNKRNNEFSDLGYVTIEQLQNSNVL